VLQSGRVGRRQRAERALPERQQRRRVLRQRRVDGDGGGGRERRHRRRLRRRQRQLRRGAKVQKARKQLTKGGQQAPELV